MRIAVFSDIHGNLEALKEILKDIEKENIDDIICLGDVIGLGPNSSECLDLIIKNNIKLVLGNHELYYLFGSNIDPTMDIRHKAHYRYIAESLNEDEKMFLEKCPLFIECKYQDKKLLFEHFLIKDKTKKYPFYSLGLLTNMKDCLPDVIKKIGADFIFIGHEHSGFTMDFEGQKLVDIGTSGCVKRNITNYTIIELRNDIQVMKKVITYDKEKLEEALKKIDYPERNQLAKHFFGYEIENIKEN